MADGRVDTAAAQVEQCVLGLRKREEGEAPHVESARGDFEGGTRLGDHGVGQRLELGVGLAQLLVALEQLLVLVELQGFAEELRRAGRTARP